MHGSKTLRLGAILEVLTGLVWILAVWSLLGAGGGEAGTSEELLTGALFGVFGLYAFNGFRVLAGLVGLVLSGKKSVLTVALGFILFLLQLIDFVQVQGNMVMVVINVLLLIIPGLYFTGALKNYKS